MSSCRIFWEFIHLSVEVAENIARASNWKHDTRKKCAVKSYVAAIQDSGVG